MVAWPFAFSLVFISMVSTAALASAESSGVGQLTVEVDNLHHQTATVRVCIFSSAQGFPGDPSKAVSCGASTKRGDKSFLFENVRHGKIAVSAYQDVNENGRLDKGWFGIPKEPAGVSRSESGPLRRPRFGESLIEFNQSELTLRVRLRSEQSP